VAKRSTRVSNGRGSSPLDKFHNIDFNDRERIEFGEWFKGRVPDLSSFIVKLSECGWKISFSFSEHYHCYFGSLTDKRPDSEYFEHTFSVRHGDFDKLTGLLGYAHEKMLVDGNFRIPTAFADNNW